MSDESNKQVELAAATAEPPTPHPLSGDVLPVDLPGRMQLTHYSPESDRAFAYARDKLSKAYREASTAVFFAAAEFDEPDGVLRPEVIEAMERSCDALDRIAAEAEQLKVPDRQEDLASKCEEFSISLGDRVAAMRTALEAGKAHRDLLAAQRQRADMLETNKANGFPFHYGLKAAGLLTKSDVDAMGEDAHMAGLDRVGRSIERFRLGQNERRLTSKPDFSMLDSIRSQIAAIPEGAAHARRLARSFSNA